MQNNSESWKTDGLAWVLANNRLTVIMPDGESKTIVKSDVFNKNSAFDMVLRAIKENRWEEVPDLMCPKKKISAFSSGNFKVVDNKVFVNDEELPEALSNKIIEYSENDLPYEPLLKFWHNLNLNPSHRAVQQLYGFLQKHNHAITPDGCFVAYKGIKSNYTDCYTGTINNEPGQTVTMPRNQVNENPEQTCSRGLHVASYEYANNHYGFGNTGLTAVVKVNPRDVVAVPVDYNNAKMRVCEYTVLEVVEQEKDDSYFHRTESRSYDTEHTTSCCNYEDDIDEYDNYDNEDETDEYYDGCY